MLMIRICLRMKSSSRLHANMHELAPCHWQHLPKARFQQERRVMSIHPRQGLTEAASTSPPAPLSFQRYQDGQRRLPHPQGTLLETVANSPVHYPKPPAPARTCSIILMITTTLKATTVCVQMTPSPMIQWVTMLGPALLLSLQPFPKIPNTKPTVTPSTFSIHNLVPVLPIATKPSSSPELMTLALPSHLHQIHGARIPRSLDSHQLVLATDIVVALVISLPSLMQALLRFLRGIKTLRRLDHLRFEMRARSSLRGRNRCRRLVKSI